LTGRDFLGKCLWVDLEADGHRIYHIGAVHAGLTFELGTNKSMWPSSRFKDRFTLLLFPILSEKLVQAKTLLKLNSIHFHDDLLCHEKYYRPWNI